MPANSEMIRVMDDGDELTPEMEDAIEEALLRSFSKAKDHHVQMEKHLNALMTATGAMFIWGQSIGLDLNDEPLATLYGPYAAIQAWKKGAVSNGTA